MEQLSDNLSLFETNKMLLSEMKTSNALALQSLQQQDEIKTELQKLVYLVNGFTSGGTPHRSYVPDHFLAAYLALVGPSLGKRISEDNNDPQEVLKGCIVIAKEMLAEVNAYNQSNAPGQEAIENALQFAKDPWSEDGAAKSKDDGF
jgi:hypothetical protein